MMMYDDDGRQPHVHSAVVKRLKVEFETLKVVSSKIYFHVCFFRYCTSIGFVFYSNFQDFIVGFEFQTWRAQI